MLWTLALVVLFAISTVALARNFRTRAPVPATAQPTAFHDALRRLAALAGPLPARPVLPQVASLCETCGSLIPEREALTTGEAVAPAGLSRPSPGWRAAGSD